MTKQNFFSLLALILVIGSSSIGYSQDPLGPAVGVVESSTESVVSISGTVAGIVGGLGLCLAIYFFATGNTKAGFATAGSVLFISALVFALLN